MLDSFSDKENSFSDEEDSFSYMEDYLPLRKINWNGENLGVLFYEAYLGVELSHDEILNYFIAKAAKKAEVHPQILAYLAKIISLGLDKKISSGEVLRGRGNKARKKTRFPVSVSERVAFSKRGQGDLITFYEKLSTPSGLVGSTSPDNIQKMHQKERERCRRLIAVKKLLDDIVEIHTRLYNSEPITFEGPHYISDQHEKLQQIYKNSNKLW